MTGAADIMGSQQGFAGPLITNPDAARGLGEVETPFVHSITFKAHAACAVTHPAIDATVAILNEGRFSAANIAAIVVKIAPAADSICNIAAPQSGLELKFSVRAVVAMTLLGIDTANPSSYSDALAADANLLSLIARTEVHLVPDFELGMTGVKIELADGCVFERQVGFDFVSDSAELTEMLSNKFVSLVAPVTGESAAEKCLAMIMGPNSHFSARTLLELVGPASA
jgi:hypothetical protein